MKDHSERTTNISEENNLLCLIEGMKCLPNNRK